MRQVRRLLKTRERPDGRRQALLNQVWAALSRHGIPVPRRVNPAALPERVDCLPLPWGERMALQATLRAAWALEAQVEASWWRSSGRWRMCPRSSFC